VKTCESGTRDEGFFLETLVVQIIWGETGIFIRATRVTGVFTRMILWRRREGKRGELNRILQHERAVKDGSYRDALLSKRRR
jgi:hypothetical protein